MIHIQHYFELCTAVCTCVFSYMCVILSRLIIITIY